MRFATMLSSLAKALFASLITGTVLAMLGITTRDIFPGMASRIDWLTRCRRTDHQLAGDLGRAQHPRRHGRDHTNLAHPDALWPQGLVRAGKEHAISEDNSCDQSGATPDQARSGWGFSPSALLETLASPRFAGSIQRSSSWVSLIL